MNNETEFKNVFRHLCHLVALTRDGKLQAAIEDIVLKVFVVHTFHAPATVTEIRESILEYFGVQLAEHEIRNALDTHVNGAKVLLQNGKYVLSAHTLAECRQRIDDSNKLQSEVKREWLIEIEDLDFAEADNWQDSIWDCLFAYMTSAFYQHGAQTIQLLDPNIHSSAEDTASLHSYATEARRRHCNDVPETTVKEAIQRFFTSTSTARTKFAVELLDGTFSYFALTTDNAVARYLTQTIPPVRLFMDSNFVFGLLDLHDNPLNEISKELVDCISENGLPISLQYTHETLNEIERTIRFYGARLRRIQWRSETSRIARNSPDISGIERRFHRLNAESTIDLDMFLSQFEQIATLLDDKGFVLFDEDISLDKSNQYDMLLAYEEYLDEHRKSRRKRHDAVKHDVVLLQLVQSIRKKPGYGLDAGAFLITADYHLASFERKKLGHDNRVVVSVFPNKIFQLLRPFIETSIKVEQQFVETFALPEFRIAQVDYSETASKILRIMNSYTDVSEESAIKILTNHLVLDQFQGAGADSGEIRQLFESEITAENARLAVNNKKLADRAAQKQLEFESMLSQSKEQAQQIREQQHLIKEIETKNKELGAKALSESEQRETLQKAMKQNRNALIRAIAFGLVGLLVPAILLTTLKSDWFDTHNYRDLLIIAWIASVLIICTRIAIGHRLESFDSNPKKNGLQLIAFAIWLTVFLWFADPENVWFGLVSTLISIVISAKGLLDRGQESPKTQA